MVGIERNKNDACERFLWVILGNLYKVNLLNKDKIYFIQVKKYAELAGISTDHAYEHMRTVANMLLHVTHKKYEEDRIVDFNIVSEVHYMAGETEIGVKFHERAIPLLSGFSKGNFTTLIGDLSKSNCKYSRFLYELCKRNLFRHGYTISLVSLYSKLKIEEGAYSSFSKFNQGVIVPSLKDINTFTDLKVWAHLEKEGRKVVGLKFEVKPRIDVVFIGADGVERRVN